MKHRLGVALALGCSGLLGQVAMGCELLVQLDRSSVDAGADAGCAICLDAAAYGNDADAADADARAVDVEVDAPTDSGSDTGG